MSLPEHANFLLIDGVLNKRKLNDLHQYEASMEVCLLYGGTRWEPLQDLGPILMKPSTPSSLITDWFSDPAAQKYSTVFSSAKFLNQVTDHLRPFICPPNALDGSGLLRFSDPLVAHYWLSSLSAEQRDQLLGPIDHWWVPLPTHSWEPPAEIAWQIFSRVNPAPSSSPVHASLDHAQLAALDKAHRWKFEEDAYQWLAERDEQLFAGMDSQSISDWLKHTIDSGLEWGLVGEKALIIWAETFADLGHDFTTRPNGPYLTWLNHNPDNACLVPVLRIKAFDHFRRSHKDTAHD
ncbi:DUF4123 domain-containing protein [Pseudomonas sp. NA-150]|uniref:DUF4123 domain-containing protein n=1 Tax=Pseudomonas sp. NA-150 TaxID=3367525 RepID=UPI0037C66F05